MQNERKGKEREKMTEISSMMHPIFAMQFMCFYALRFHRTLPHLVLLGFFFFSSLHNFWDSCTIWTHSDAIKNKQFLFCLERKWKRKTTTKSFTLFATLWNGNKITAKLELKLTKEKSDWNSVWTQSLLILVNDLFWNHFRCFLNEKKT